MRSKYGRSWQSLAFVGELLDRASCAAPSVGAQIFRQAASHRARGWDMGHAAHFALMFLNEPHGAPFACIIGQWPARVPLAPPCSDYSRSAPQAGLRTPPALLTARRGSPTRP